MTDTGTAPQPGAWVRNIRAIARVALARGVGAGLGLVVGLLMANRFGAGSATDAFFFARRLTSGVTETLNRLVVFVYVPSLVADLQDRGYLHKGRLWMGSMTRGLVIAVFAAGLLSVAAPWVVSILAPGFDPSRYELATLLLRILLFLIPASLVLSGITSLLFASRTFGRAEVAAILPRLLMVGLLLFFVPPLGVTALCWALAGGTLLAGLALILSQLGALRAAASRRSAPFTSDDLTSDSAATPLGERESQTGGRMLPLLLMHGFRLGSTWIDIALASTLFVGAVSVLEYAHRIVFLAASVLAASVVTVMYTEYAHDSAQGDIMALRRKVVATQRAGTFLLLPFLTFLWVTADVLIDALFVHGAFDSRSAALTASVARFYTLVFLMAFFVNSVVTGIYTDATAPRVKIVGCIAAVGLATRLGAVFPLALAYGVVGIAIAATLSAAVVAIFTFVLASRHWQGLLERSDLRAGVEMLVCTILALGAMRAGLAFLPDGATTITQIAALAGIGLAGAAVYLGAAASLGVSEFNDLRVALRRQSAPRSG